MSRPVQVKNRAAAAIQISTEQIIREAADRQEAHTLEPIVKIHDAEEYQSFLGDRRKHFEDNIRYRREHMGNWVKYARFEEENNEFDRARSIFERAIEVDHRSSELWLRYAEFEMRHEFVNRARNVLDRAVQILPRVDFLWYKYVYMEEMVGDIPKTRAVFERWMEWMPDDNAWLAYARFETRTHSLDRAQAVMKRYVNTYPSAQSFLRFAKWAEFEAKDIPLARTIFESCLTELDPEESKQARVFKQFAFFEERQEEYDRARVIYNYAIQLLNLGSSNSNSNENDAENVSDNELAKRDELYKAYITFEKKHGNREGIEHVVLTKQRNGYKKQLDADPYDYDSWFEYAKLEEDHGDVNSVREVYEQAVSNVPPSKEKQYWRRYIYLWIYYAVYEELSNNDLVRASEVYNMCLQLIPHKQFTFAKIWILAAKLLIRRKDLTAARKLLGKAIGMSASDSKKEKLFTEYIAIELALGEVDRCRSLYTNYVKTLPSNCRAWTRYADLEKSVGETDRCRAIYELAVSQELLDEPEIVWKKYIDFEIEEGESERVRQLYKRLLEKTNHIKVWISYAQFEGTEIGKGTEEVRRVFDEAYKQLLEQQPAEQSETDISTLKEERVMLLDAWRVYEKEKGDAHSVQKIEAMLPRRMKRKRMRRDENGNDLGWEEYFDYQFPDEEGASAGNLKLLEMAAKWKRRKVNNDDDDDDADSDLDSDDD